MSETVATTMCRFPGCSRPVVPPTSPTGRPPEYCDDPKHTAGAAWRARQGERRETAGRAPAVEERPVDAARQRASEIRGQVAGMGELLVQQFQALVEELRTVADPDAAEAQLESMSTDAAERVAAAAARAMRADQAQRTAEAERVEADAAAAEAVELAEQRGTDLEEVRSLLAERDRAAALLTAELAETQAAAQDQAERAQEDLAQLGQDLTTTRERLEGAERDRDLATNRAETSATARVEAEERARGALTRADAEAARAQRAEAETSHVREQLDQARVELDAQREAAGELRGKLATANAERDAARADVKREEAHGAQRVGDLRATHEQQLDQLHDELTQARAEAREQRSRADRAEAQRRSGPEGSSAVSG